MRLRLTSLTAVFLAILLLSGCVKKEERTSMQLEAEYDKGAIYNVGADFAITRISVSSPHTAKYFLDTLKTLGIHHDYESQLSFETFVLRTVRIDLERLLSDTTGSALTLPEQAGESIVDSVIEVEYLLADHAVDFKSAEHPGKPFAVPVTSVTIRRGESSGDSKGKTRSRKQKEEVSPGTGRWIKSALEAKSIPAEVLASHFYRGMTVRALIELLPGKPDSTARGEG